MTIENNITMRSVPLSLAIALSIAGTQVSFAAPGEVNSINNGPVVQPGTYFNTEGSRTTFQSSNGLHVRAGDLVIGLESNTTGIPTGNGGTMYFRAPGSVIRIDGTIDVSAIRDGGRYLGNGGKAFFDSAYLFQNGNVFANGFNGGLIQYNVGGMTLGPNARISAQGFGGNGGVININSPGTVDIQAGAIVDTSGKVLGTFDTNVINIEGGVVNNEGILRANGLALVDFKNDHGDAALVSAQPGLRNNPAPGTITAGEGDGTMMGGVEADHRVPGEPGNRGGMVRLIATGQSYSTVAGINATSQDIVSSEGKSALNTRNNGLVSTSNGDVVNRGTIEANGALEQNGGTVLIGAARDINNFATVRANGADARDGVFDANGNGLNGGHGGTVSLNAMRTILNRSVIDASGGRGGRAASTNLATGNGRDANVTITTVAGKGGNGGLIGLSYQTFTNNATVRANGGQGGTGGSANTFDQEFATASNPNPTARANSVAGQGGQGGDGGLIVLSGNFNVGGGAILRADGGQGGRGGNATAGAEAFSNTGTPNPQATATAGAGGHDGSAGTVVVPSPGTLSQSQVFTAKNGGVGDSGMATARNTSIRNGVANTTDTNTPSTLGSATSGNNNALLETRRNELLVHQENALLLSQRGGVGTNQEMLSGRLSESLVRMVGNPDGTSGNSLNASAPAANLVIANSGANDLTNDFENANADPIFFNLGSLTILNNGDITNDMHWSPGVHQVGPGFHDVEISLGGGYHSWLGSGSIINNGFILSRGLWTGGSIHLAAGQDITNNHVILNTAFNKHTASGFSPTPGYISSHSGSTGLKAGRDITNNHLLNSNLAFGEIHPPLNGIEWSKFLNAGQIGSTVYMLSGRDFNQAADAVTGAEALTYRDTSVDDGADHPANAFGGIMTIKAGGTIRPNGTFNANARSFQGDSGNFTFTSTDGMTQTHSQNGQIRVE